MMAGKGIGPLLLIGGAAALLLLRKKEEPRPNGANAERLDSWGFPRTWEITYETGPMHNDESVIRVYDTGAGYTIAYRLPENKDFVRGGSTEPGYLHEDRHAATTAAATLQEEFYPDF